MKYTNFIQSIISNPNSPNKIIISSPGIAVSGYLTQSISFDATASWSPIMEVSEFQKKINTFIQSIKKNSTSSSGIIYPIQERKSWTSSEMSPYNFNFFIIALRNEDNILKKVIDLSKGIFPITYGKGNKKSFSAPNNYSANLSGKPSNTWKVTIGSKRRFTIPGLVMTNLKYEISNETLPNSQKPLYIKVDVTFDDVQPIGIDEFYEIFGEEM